MEASGLMKAPTLFRMVEAEIKHTVSCKTSIMTIDRNKEYVVVKPVVWAWQGVV
jgi:hypothetical protein